MLLVVPTSATTNVFVAVFRLDGVDDVVSGLRTTRLMLDSHKELGKRKTRVATEMWASPPVLLLVLPRTKKADHTSSQVTHECVSKATADDPPSLSAI